MTVEKINLEPLGDDARMVAGVIFGNMRPEEFYRDIEPASLGGDPGLVMHLVQAVPHPRTQAALDELVANGVIRKMPAGDHPDVRGVRYLPLVDCFDAFIWVQETLRGRDTPRHASLKWPVMISTSPDSKAPGEMSIEQPAQLGRKSRSQRWGDPDPSPRT